MAGPRAQSGRAAAGRLPRRQTPFAQTWPRGVLRAGQGHEGAEGALSRAVLWDLDGTLVDSEDYHWQAWRDILAPEGLSITYDQFLASFGRKNDPIMREWLGDG